MTQGPRSARSPPRDRLHRSRLLDARARRSGVRGPPDPRRRGWRTPAPEQGDRSGQVGSELHDRVRAPLGHDQCVRSDPLDEPGGQSKATGTGNVVVTWGDAFAGWCAPIATVKGGSATATPPTTTTSTTTTPTSTTQTSSSTSSTSTTTTQTPSGGAYADASIVPRSGCRPSSPWRLTTRSASLPRSRSRSRWCAGREQGQASRSRRTCPSAPGRASRVAEASRRAVSRRIPGKSVRSSATYKR